MQPRMEEEAKCFYIPSKMPKFLPIQYKYLLNWFDFGWMICVTWIPDKRCIRARCIRVGIRQNELNRREYKWIWSQKNAQVLHLNYPVKFISSIQYWNPFRSLFLWNVIVLLTWQHSYLISLEDTLYNDRLSKSNWSLIESRTIGTSPKTFWTSPYIKHLKPFGLSLANSEKIRGPMWQLSEAHLFHKTQPPNRTQWNTIR